MTAKEAIEVLEKPSTHIHVVHKSENGMEFLAYSEKLVKAFEMAIEALEKLDALEHIIERLETNIDTAYEDRFMTYPRSSGRNFAYGVEIGLKKAVEIIKEEVG